MMDPLDHDPMDDLVRTARPVAPPRLASNIAARLAARSSRLRAMVGGVSVLAAAALVMLWIHRGSDAVPGPSSEPRPALAFAIDAGADSATIVPTDSGAPGWAEMPALLAELERAHRAAIASCRSADVSPALSGPALPTFRIERQPDGTSRSDLVIHHSLGYLGYSGEERCLQKVAASFVVPPLPAPLSSVAFTLAPSASPSDDAWRDPTRTGEDLLAPVRTRVKACVPDGRIPCGRRPTASCGELHVEHPIAVFEPGGGPYRQNRGLARARIVLDDRATGEMRSCVSRLAREIVVPALPEHVDQIMLTLTLPP